MRPFFLPPFDHCSIDPPISKTPDLHVNQQSARNMHHKVYSYASDRTNQKKHPRQPNLGLPSSHQSVTDPKTDKMPYTQLQILNYLTVTKRLKTVDTPPTSLDCHQQHHLKISQPSSRTKCRLVLEFPENKRQGAKSGRKMIVFKAKGPKSRVGACGLGDCLVCGRFLGKFRLPFVFMLVSVVVCS
jgi:hypothetical protein